MPRPNIARPLVPLTALALFATAGCTGQNGAFAPTAPGVEEDVWGIRCVSLQGSNHVSLAKNYERALKNVKGLEPDLVRVYHEQSRSTVFYGRYRRTYDVSKNKERFSPNPVADLQRIRELSLTVNELGATRNVWPFRLADLGALPTTPIGDPAWDLAAADGYWTVHVAVFYNTGDMRRRKYTAVEYCRLLREQGVEAYYHHGPVNSSVCVGLFPKSSIVEVTREDPFTGRLRARRRIVDPGIMKLMERFPETLHNGHKMYEIDRDASGEVVRRELMRSFTAMTPRAEGRGPAPQPSGNPLTPP